MDIYAVFIVLTIANGSTLDHGSLRIHVGFGEVFGTCRQVKSLNDWNVATHQARWVMLEYSSGQLLVSASRG